jgi:hypothetical protein
MSISRPQRRAVIERAENCCEYCHLPSNAGTIPYHVDHIKSIKHGGANTLNNLCYACFPCNLYKGPIIAAEDPQTGFASFLFNPRLHIWDEHFQINSDASLKGLTPEGRTTIDVLRINDKQRIEKRWLAMEVDLYPCQPAPKPEDK